MKQTVPIMSYKLSKARKKAHVILLQTKLSKKLMFYLNKKDRKNSILLINDLGAQSLESFCWDLRNSDERV